MSEKSEKTSAAEQQAPADAVYAELPAPTASIGIDDAWHEPAMRDFADRTHALRMEAAPKAAPGEPVHGDVLPPVGSRVYIRHGRDNDAHACAVTGYYAWGDLGGDKRLHRVFVRLVYEGTDIQQARMLCDCYPTAEAALAQAAPQQEAQEPTTLDQKTMELAESVGLIGPASRIGDLHAAIQRFHDLICVNATIKAAVMAADVISGVATPARDYPPLPMQFACSGVLPVYSADQMRAYVDADRAAYAPASSQPAPAPLSRDQIREVFMAHGFTVKEGQTDLKQYVYDAAYALLELVAAPQQEAQEPYGYVFAEQYAPIVGSELKTTREVFTRVKPGRQCLALYTAPQPAPECHHRPPCAECASLTAQGGK